MPWLRQVLVPVSMSPASDAALSYAGFLAEFYGARLDVLHVVQEPEGTQAGPRGEACETFFTLLDRGHALRRRLVRHERPAVRSARVLVEVGRPEEVIARRMRSGRYQLAVVEHAWVPSLTADGASACSIVPVREDLQVPPM